MVVRKCHHSYTGLLGSQQNQQAQNNQNQQANNGYNANNQAPVPQKSNIPTRYMLHIIPSNIGQCKFL